MRADQKVVVTLLGKERRRMEATAIDVSGCGMRIVAPQRALPGDPVKISLEDTLLLGEVCYCHPHEGGFLIGIEVEQALRHLKQLADLNRVLLQEDATTGTLSER